MVIDYDSVNVSFQKLGNRLQHVIIDYISEPVKIVRNGNRLQNVIIDYISENLASFEKLVIDYNTM